ncbi:MAG: hypothetical protein AAF939_19045, partial [Planctomycetota bacterium]
MQTWIKEHWKKLRFNRLNFDRQFVVDQVLSKSPRHEVLLVRRQGGSTQTVMKLSDPAARNPLELRCLRSLRHPGVAKYLGHGHTRKNRIWTEYEYVDGTPLSARIGKSNRNK